MIDPQPTTGVHPVTNTQNDDDPGTPHYSLSSTPEGEPGSTEMDPFAEGHTGRRR